MKTYTQKAKDYEQQAREESDPVKAGELFERANRCYDLAKEPVIIDEGVPCGFCGSTIGRSNEEGTGDGWHRCMGCGGC